MTGLFAKVEAGTSTRFPLACLPQSDGELGCVREPITVRESAVATGLRRLHRWQCSTAVRRGHADQRRPKPGGKSPSSLVLEHRPSVHNVDPPPLAENYLLKPGLV